MFKKGPSDMDIKLAGYVLRDINQLLESESFKKYSYYKPEVGAYTGGDGGDGQYASLSSVLADRQGIKSSHYGDAPPPPPGPPPPLSKPPAIRPPQSIPPPIIDTPAAIPPVNKELSDNVLRKLALEKGIPLHYGLTQFRDDVKRKLEAKEGFGYNDANNLWRLLLSEYKDKMDEINVLSSNTLYVNESNVNEFYERIRMLPLTVKKSGNTYTLGLVRVEKQSGSNPLVSLDEIEGKINDITNDLKSVVNYSISSNCLDKKTIDASLNLQKQGNYLLHEVSCSYKSFIGSLENRLDRNKGSVYVTDLEYERLKMYAETLNKLEETIKRAFNTIDNKIPLAHEQLNILAGLIKDIPRGRRVGSGYVDFKTSHQKTADILWAGGNAVHEFWKYMLIAACVVILLIIVCRIVNGGSNGAKESINQQPMGMVESSGALEPAEIFSVHSESFEQPDGMTELFEQPDGSMEVFDPLKNNPLDNGIVPV